MTRYRNAFLIAPLCLSLFPQVASADWIRDRLDAACSEESANQVADATRGRIEDAVSRAESAIKPPIPVGDLGCLDDLMETPLDFFSGSIGLPDLSGIFDSTLDGVLDMGDGVTRNICQFAEEKWQEVTGPLSDVTNSIGGIGDNFDKFASGGGGSGSGFTPTNTTPNTTKPLINAADQWSQTSTGVYYNQGTGQAFVPDGGLYYENGVFMGVRNPADVLPPSLVGNQGPTPEVAPSPATGIWNNIIGGASK